MHIDFVSYGAPGIGARAPLDYLWGSLPSQTLKTHAACGFLPAYLMLLHISLLG